MTTAVAPVVVDHLTKRFGRRRGVTDVTLTVGAGEVFGFLGPNGAGKSTTIRCLLGLYRPTSGHVRVLGHDPTAPSRDFLADVGYLPGELQLPGALTGAELVRRVARARGKRDGRCADELVERLGAELHRPVRTLSKGNKQKLGLVLAFMHRPRLLVLDEPTSGLDPLLQDEFASLLREAAGGGATVLLSSHDLDAVQRMAHRVAIIRSGRIVVDDTVDALRDRAPSTIELRFDHDVDDRALRAVPGVTVRTADPRTITLLHTGSAAPLLAVVGRLGPSAISARPANLDELFLRLYEEEDSRAS